MARADLRTNSYEQFILLGPKGELHPQVGSLISLHFLRGYEYLSLKTDIDSMRKAPFLA